MLSNRSIRRPATFSIRMLAKYPPIHRTQMSSDTHLKTRFAFLIMAIAKSKDSHLNRYSKFKSSCYSLGLISGRVQ